MAAKPPLADVPVSCYDGYIYPKSLTPFCSGDSVAMAIDADVPEGHRFLKLVWSLEDECQTQTDCRLPDLGKKAPECLKQIGTALSLMDRMASCWWVYREGDHRIEYLCGRSASSARAVLRLIRLGFYDEALVLSRGLGEIANLMQLFCSDADALDEWKGASPTKIRKDFSPVKVRLRIETVSMSPAIKEDRYRLLSERAAHVHPGTTPQSHNTLGMPVAGAQLQDAGILVCLNELALPLCIIATFGAKLLDLDNETTKYIFSSAKALAEQIGGADITSIDEHHQRSILHPIAGQDAEIAERLLRNYQSQLDRRPGGHPRQDNPKS